MRDLSEIGLDSQCLTYLISALEGVAAPSDSLAEQKVALVRLYLYTPGTVWVTPTVHPVAHAASLLRDWENVSTASCPRSLLLDHPGLDRAVPAFSRVLGLGGFRDGDGDAMRRIDGSNPAPRMLFASCMAALRIPAMPIGHSGRCRSPVPARRSPGA